MDPYDDPPDWWQAMQSELAELYEMTAEEAANDELRELAEAQEAIEWWTGRTA